MGNVGTRGCGVAGTPPKLLGGGSPTSALSAGFQGGTAGSAWMMLGTVPHPRGIPAASPGLCSWGGGRQHTEQSAGGSGSPREGPQLLWKGAFAGTLLEGDKWQSQHAAGGPSPTPLPSGGPYAPPPPRPLTHASTPGPADGSSGPAQLGSGSTAFQLRPSPTVGIFRPSFQFSSSPKLFISALVTPSLFQPQAQGPYSSSNTTVVISAPALWCFSPSPTSFISSPAPRLVFRLQLCILSAPSPALEFLFQISAYSIYSSSASCQFQPHGLQPSPRLLTSVRAKGKGLRLRRGRFTWDIGKCFFTRRPARHCSRLPSAVGQPPSPGVFTRPVDAGLRAMA